MKIYFTPGPSQLYHTYEYHLKEALKRQLGSISHRGPEFQKIYSQTEETLKELLDVPGDFRVLFLSSATDIWERILQNLVKKTSHHFVNGAFSERFFDFSKKLEKSSTQTLGDGISEFGSFDVPEEAELIAITKNETSKGFNFDDSHLAHLRDAHPGKHLTLDTVSVIPAVPIDFNLLDATYFSVQKSFGMPAGLGVWILNQNAIENSLSQEIVKGTYRSLSSLIKYADKNQTPETPNVLAIYVLGKIAQDMIARGIKIIRNETTYKSTLLYQCLESHPMLSPAVSSKPNRSKTVVVANCGNHQQKILDHLSRKGMILGKGYGKAKDTQLRIANFPAHSKEQIELLCDLLMKLT